MKGAFALHEAAPCASEPRLSARSPLPSRKKASTFDKKPSVFDEKRCTFRPPFPPRRLHPTATSRTASGTTPRRRSESPPLTRRQRSCTQPKAVARRAKHLAHPTSPDEHTAESRSHSVKSRATRAALPLRALYSPSISPTHHAGHQDSRVRGPACCIFAPQPAPTAPPVRQ